MPTYDYRCDANARVVEVKHPMSDSVENWGDLCERAGIDPGDTPREAAVSRLSTGGHVIGAERLGNPAPCGTGTACPTGSCPSGVYGLN
ncbi:MAG: hypothetical protein U5S82_15945 [Gammaproteobacteria bacterium]|nr:hypothetical protein [Gammaproteobacteria bacterium]